jgi:hypothetical protein
MGAVEVPRVMTVGREPGEATVAGRKVGTVRTRVVPEMLVVRIAVLIRLAGTVDAGTVTTTGRPETTVVRIAVGEGAAIVKVVPSIWVVVTPVVGTETGVPSDTVGKNTMGLSVVGEVTGGLVAAPLEPATVDAGAERVS